MNYDITSPIFLVGPHRSGTTWLSEAFERSPEVAYMKEPRQVWQWGHWFRHDDYLDAHDATPKIKKHIRKVFSKYTTKSGCTRFCEKTPSNCLRIGFLHEVFPDGKIVFIIRDGRSVLRSTHERMTNNISWGSYWERIYLRIAQSSFSDMPSLASKVPYLLAKLTGRPIKFWGSRPPGWRQWLDHDSTEVMIAKQWAHMVTAAMDDLEKIPRENIYMLSYEELVEKPVDTMHKILDFVGLRQKESIIKYVKETADPSRKHKWKYELEADLLKKVRPHMEHVMTRVGYDWTAQI